MLFTITLDHIKVLVKPFHKTLYQVLNHIYYDIPHFCYNKRLFIGGNCRMCLVEIVNVPKPIVSCSMPVSPGLEILTKSAFILKSRENLLEFLLLNHPLDCAICDQGGECDLQEYTELYGQSTGRAFFFKKAVSSKNISPLIISSMDRCIKCTKCIRLSFYIGFGGLTLVGRSVKAQIYNVLNVNIFKRLNESHELLSNLLDICPVNKKVVEKRNREGWSFFLYLQSYLGRINIASKIGLIIPLLAIAGLNLGLLWLYNHNQYAEYDYSKFFQLALSSYQCHIQYGEGPFPHVVFDTILDVNKAMVEKSSIEGPFSVNFVKSHQKDSVSIIKFALFHLKQSTIYGGHYQNLDSMMAFKEALPAEYSDKIVIPSGNGFKYFLGSFCINIVIIGTFCFVKSPVFV